MQRGKKYRAHKEKVDSTKFFSIDKAVELAKSTSYTKFDGTLEIATKVNYKSLQNIRGTISLPHGTGKKFVFLSFAKGTNKTMQKLPEPIS